MANLGTLTLDLIAKIGGFTGPMDRAGRQVKSFQQQMGSLERDMRVLALNAATQLTGKVLGVGKAFVDMSRETAGAVEQLTNMAEAIGITTQEMDRLVNVGKLQNIEANEITSAMQKLSKAFEEAKDPTSQQAKIFQVLSQATGQNILEMKDMAKILLAVSDGFSKFEAGTSRTTAATELFGKAGQRLLVLFSKSQEEMANLTAEAEKFGGVISDLEAEKLTKLDAAFDHLELSLQSFKRAAANTSASFIDNIALMIKGVGDFIAFEDRFVAHMKGGGVEFGRVPFGANNDDVKYFERTEDFMKRMDAWMPKRISEAKELAKTPFPTIDVEAMKRTEDFLKKSKEMSVKAAADSAKAIRDIEKSLASDIQDLQLEAILDPIQKINKAYEVQIQAVKMLALLQSSLGETVDSASINEKARLLDEIRAAKVAAEVNKGFAPVPRFEMTATEGFDRDEQSLNEWYATQLDLLESYRASKLGTEEEWNAKEQELTQQHADELNKIQMARTKLVLSSASAMFGDLATIVGTFAGEESAVYKELFAVSKAFSIAEATLNMFQAISEAGTLPFPANIPAMAAVAASMASIISSISAVGLAHEGMDSIPTSGSWLLEKGERVTTEKTSKRLDRTLDRIQNQQTGGANGSWNVTVNEAPGTTAQVSRRQDGGLDVNIALIEEKLLERMNRGSGLAQPFDRRYGRKL